MHNIIAGNLPENIFVILFGISGAFQVHENIPICQDFIWTLVSCFGKSDKQQSSCEQVKPRFTTRVDTRCEALWGKHSHLHVSDLWVKSITPYKKPLTLLLSVLYEVKS